MPSTRPGCPSPADLSAQWQFREESVRRLRREKTRAWPSGVRYQARREGWRGWRTSRGSHSLRPISQDLLPLLLGDSLLSQLGRNVGPDLFLKILPEPFDLLCPLGRGKLWSAGRQ